MQCLASFALCQLGNRDSRPFGYDSCNLILCHALPHKAQILIPNPLLFCLQFLLKLRQPAVLQLRSLIQVILLLCVLNLPVHTLYLLPEGGETVHAGLLILPLGLLGCKFIVKLSQLLLEVRQAVLAQAVSFLFEGCLFYLHLHDFPGHFIQLSRHGIHLSLNHGAGFIHQVNGLIRQETVGNIPVGQCGRADQCRVCYLHPMEYLIALLKPPQYGYGILYRWFVYHHRLEPSLQRRILFYILAVLIEGCGSDTVEFSPGQHGL